MNYRGKDKLAEALMKGLLETPRPKKDEPVISETLAARLAAYQEPKKETVKDISGVSEALKPKKAPWEMKLVEEKPAKVLVEAKIAPKKKTIQEIASTVRLNKVEEKPLIINESTDSIADILTNQGKRMWRPAKTETLEEKIERLEGALSLFEEGSHEYLKKIHAGATSKNRDGWSEHVISHGGKKYRLVTNGVRAQMENYRGHVVPQKKVASLISKLAESVEPLNELSNDTLKSYVGKFRKSYDDTMDARSKNVTQPALKSGNMGMLSKDKQKELDGYNRKLTNRARGKDKANDRLRKNDPTFYQMKRTNEEVLNEEAEPKHKFNKVLASHGYVYKGSHTEKSLGGRDHDFPSHNYEHPKTGGKVHIWQQKGAADSFHSRHKQKNGITAPGAGDTKGQLDRHLDRWNKYHGLNEEQLNELSSATLGSYLRHASVQSDQLHRKSDEMVDKINDKNTSPWERDAYYDHNKKFLKKVQHKAGQRNLGMHRAEKKLVAKDKKYGEHHEPEDTPQSRLKQLYDMERGPRNDVERHDEYGYKKRKPKSSIWNGLKKKLGMKEEVEQLDEISAQVVDNYKNKAWRSQANAHIDRGGADFLDDDKARKTATRTIGKRERGLALAKSIMKKKDC